MPAILNNVSNVDICLGIIFISSFFYGVYKGFISLASPFIAAFLSFNTSAFLRPFLLEHFGIYFENKTGILFSVLILIILYAIFRILMSKIERALKGFLRAIFLRWVDRVLGGLAFLLIIGFLVFIFFVLLREFIYPNRNIVDIVNSNIIDFLVISIRKIGLFPKII